MRLTVALLASTPLMAVAVPLGTAITYQGRLEQAGAPANGLFDFQACIYEEPAAGPPLACAPDVNDLPVEDGVFTASLDFGEDVFVGEKRFLELRVREGASVNPFEILNPRQEVRPSPNALHAAQSESAPWGGLTETPPDFADGTDDGITSIVAGTGLSGGTITSTGVVAVDTDAIQRRVVGECVAGSVTAVNADGSVECAQSGSGTVTSITAGEGLSGGTISTSGTISLAIGGVGAAHIDPAQVQARIAGSCPAGQHIRGVDQAGGVLCEQGASGTVTSITAGTGLSGGVISNSGTIAVANGGIGVTQINPSEVQARIVGFCSAGQHMRGVTQSGAVTCEQGVTSITAGTGLSGGVISGAGTIAVANGGIGAAQINPAEVQARIASSCPVGEYLRGVDQAGGVICESVPGVPSDSVLDNIANTVGMHSSIAIGTDGRPIISYYNSSVGELKIAKCANARCSSASFIGTLDSVGDVGKYSSIKVPTDGLPVISYYDQTQTALKVAKCQSPDCSTGATISIVDNAADAGQYSSLAVDAQNNPVIAYQYIEPAHYAVKVARCSSVDCATGNVLQEIASNSSPFGTDISLAIAAGDIPVASFHDETGTQGLHYARCLTSNCSSASTVVIDNPANIVGRYSSLALTSNSPVISYYDSSTGGLKAAVCSSITCGSVAIRVIDSPTADVGMFSSIAVPSDGIPVIAYHDATAQALKVARCHTAGCVDASVTTVLDLAGSVGQYASIAVGSDGLPVISSFSSGPAALSVAKCGTKACL